MFKRILRIVAPVANFNGCAGPPSGCGNRPGRLRRYPPLQGLRASVGDGRWRAQQSEFPSVCRSDTATAAGFIFGYPLRTGHPTDRANKVLWVVRFPRNGSPLNISGQLSGANAPAVHVTQLADSGPGEIYPSIVDVPQPGCWRFDLTWSTHQATVYLEYQ